MTMMRYAVCVQFDDNEAKAWVPALPGCFCAAPTEAEAVERVSVAIDEYLGWLRRHGEEITLADANEIEVVERIEAPPGRSEPCFAADRAPAAEEEIETAIRLMAFAREDLLVLVAPLPDRVLDWQPRPDKRCIREILAHIARADGYYRSSLLEEQPLEEAPEERLDLTLQREKAIAHLRSLTTAQRAQVFHPDWPWRHNEDEDWTVRKALRRFIYHERFHTRDIQQTLAWLMLGGPSKPTEGATPHA